MTAGIGLTFLIAFAATFLGTIPFGPINLSVVNITLKKTIQKGFQFSIGASLIEIAEVAVAIAFGSYIQNFLKNYTWIQLIVIALFLGIGIFYIFRKTRPTLESNPKYRVGDFYKGILIALANPQALPFWVFVLTLIAQYVIVDYSGVYLFWFFTGVFAGKLAALMLFAYLSEFLRRRLETSCKLVNRTLGSVLVLIGLVQAFKYFFND